jgi:bifunctional non-homologous end joining protein LigD
MAKRTSTRFTARMIEGATPSEMPGFIKPQLATLKLKAPNGDQWLHEIKYDGYRLQIHLNKGRVTVYTRNGLGWTRRFAGIADGFAIPVAFDLLFLEGFDLRGSPRIERKRVLKMLFDKTGLAYPILYSDHLVTDGNEMFAHACKLKWEGIVSKNPDAPYRSDRNEGWLKTKCAQRGKFPVIGFVKDPSGVAALYLGKREGKELHYMGKVGTGWSRTVSSQIRKQLNTGHKPQIQADETDPHAKGDMG